jgi:autoinducer 2-degrading protein
MFTLIVRVTVKPEFIEQYKVAILEDALGSVRDEPGCLRFDVSVDNAEPNVLYFYEVYRDEDAFKAHTQAPHFVKYRNAVQGMAEGSVAYRATSLFPSERDWAKPTISG